MDIRKMVAFGCLLGCTMAYGQARENFMQQQAYAEMQRVSGQVDVLQSNLGDLQRRIGALEGGGDASKGVRQELDALKASIAELRREMQNMRGEIVKDLSGKMVQIQKQMQPPPAPKPTTTKVVIGPHQEYVVQSGDTLSLIAQAFGTSVGKIKEMNSLKGDNLRVGQKLNLPK